MTVPLQLRLLDAVRRSWRGSISDLTLREIEQARGPYVAAGTGGEAILHSITGRPRPEVTVTDVTVPGAVGDLPARRHQPLTVASRRPLVLHLHGGGWVVGGAVQYDWICGELAAGLGAVVVSLDYRLAPEHPAPAAAQDCLAVARWLLDQGGRSAVGAPGPLVVVGDSAGGNLAALVALAARDHGLSGLAGQLLVYPGTDLTMSSRSATTQTDEPFLSRRDMEAFLDLYLAGGVDPRDPAVSPLHARDLGGLAPACVLTAEHDPLRDEGLAYAERLAAAGVTVRHTEYLDMPHGFVSLPGLTRSARQAVAELVAFARPLIATE